MANERLATEVWNSRRVGFKHQSYVLFQEGILGNKPLTWNSLAEVRASGWDGLICIRSRKGIARSKTEFNKNYAEAEETVKTWISQGLDSKDITFNQAMPDQDLILQGEVQRMEGGLYLYGTFVKKPMNLGLAEKSFSINGFGALSLLQKSLYPQSYADLERLLEQFPDSILEFSSYSRSVGDLPGRNTVFWELRNY